MNEQKKIERWCRDEHFVHYANERMNEELGHAPNHRSDPEYEELDEAFEWDDRYIVPLVTYLTYRLQLAKLQNNARKRSNGIWLVFVQVIMLGHYTQVFSEEFGKLQTELRETVMTMLHDEYVWLLNKKKE